MINETPEEKIGPSDFRVEAERMLRDGTMPSLNEVLSAVSESRKKFSSKIRDARQLPEGSVD
jgi:hypothetical protein